MPAPQHHTFAAAVFEDTVAHEGNGAIRAARVQERAPFSGATWVDLVEVPPGRSIGSHRHSTADEEIYVCIDGVGAMEVDGERLTIGPGDVVVNRPGGVHGLLNTGAEPLRLVVVDTAVRPG
jgi:quercetin dioxygenase-like cupin family protein